MELLTIYKIETTPAGKAKGPGLKGHEAMKALKQAAQANKKPRAKEPEAPIPEGVSRYVWNPQSNSFQEQI